MTGSVSAVDRRRAMLAWLGLPPGASAAAIEATYRDIVAYLARAPRDVRSWADRESETAAQAYLSLIDPAATAGPDALADAVGPAVPPGGPATPPARRDIAPDVKPAVSSLLAEAAPDLHPDVLPDAVGTTGGSSVAISRRNPMVRRLIVAGGVVLGLGAVLLVGYNAGAPAAPLAGGAAASASAEPGLDETAVSALMARIQADPQDTDALQSLADEFYAAGDFTTTIEWLQKLLAVEPDNVQALVGLGAAAFNSGDDATAKASWLRALEIDPANVEAHYDLGFLYYSVEPVDLDGVRREWQQVVDLAPGTQIAETVRAHLDTLASPAPSAATPSGAAPSGAAPSAGSSAATSASSAPSAPPTEDASSPRP